MNYDLLEQLKKQYTVDKWGLIEDFGKFERETLDVPYFWNRVNNGEGIQIADNIWEIVADIPEQAEFNVDETVQLLLTESGFVRML